MNFKKATAFPVSSHKKMTVFTPSFFSSFQANMVKIKYINMLFSYKGSATWVKFNASKKKSKAELHWKNVSTKQMSHATHNPFSKPTKKPHARLKKFNTGSLLMRFSAFSTNFTASHTANFPHPADDKSPGYCFPPDFPSENPANAYFQ